MSVMKNLNDLAKYVNAQVKQSLKDDVAPTIKDRMQEHVESDVYNVYTPLVHKRTGGLKRDITIKDAVNGVAIVPTKTDDQTGKYVPIVVETGQGYTYSGYGYGYEKPRSFVENTAKELQNSGEHALKLKKSLQTKGISVK